MYTIHLNKSSCSVFICHRTPCAFSKKKKEEEKIHCLFFASSLRPPIQDTHPVHTAALWLAALRHRRFVVTMAEKLRWQKRDSPYIQRTTWCEIEGQEHRLIYLFLVHPTKTIYTARIACSSIFVERCPGWVAISKVLQRAYIPCNKACSPLCYSVWSQFYL